MAELFTAISVLLFYKAATEENRPWIITLGVLGVITAFIAVVAIVLFIQEYEKRFTFLDKIEARNAKKIGFKYGTKSKGMIMGQPGSGKAYCNEKPIHISEYQNICEQYGNNDDTCYALAPTRYKSCCAEHCPYGFPATDEDFVRAGIDPAKNDGNYVIPHPLAIKNTILNTDGNTVSQ